MRGAPPRAHARALLSRTTIAALLAHPIFEDPIAAFADAHLRVTKSGGDDAVHTEVVALKDAARVEELARMHAGEEVTAKTRAHAKELLAQARRG